jgi:hypothetical protein
MRTRNLGRVITITGALGVAFGCNAILGIDEPKLVAGTGGKGSGGEGGDGGEGSGGDTETGGTDGGGNATGSGGTSSGGKVGSGGTASGGTASGGSSGSGGTATGGSVATGGSTDAGPQAPSGVPGQVACGTESCRIASGSGCCVQTTSGDDPHCAASCDSGSQTRYNCDGDEDCNAAAPVCCLALGSNTAQCAASCTGRVLCGADADCAPGQYCAPGTGAFEVVSICTRAPTKDFVWCDGTPCDRAGGKACCFDKNTNTATCTASCPADDIKYQCDDPTDCPNMLCCETRTGIGVLTGSSCQTTCAPGAVAFGCGSAGNCAAGEVCCLAVAGGGSNCVPQCAAAVLCGNDADCGSANSCNLVTLALPATPTGRTSCSTNAATGTD